MDEVKKFWFDVIGKEVGVYIVNTPKSSKNLKENKHPNGTMRLQIHNKEFLYMVLGGIEELSNKMAL